MPISSSAASIEKKRAFRIRGKTAAASVDISDKETSHKNFLTIGPALPPSLPCTKRKFLKRSLSNLSVATAGLNLDNDSAEAPIQLHNFPDGTIHVSRTQKAKEKNPGRVCLDRRGLSSIPVVEGEPQLRLLSLQHNLVSKLDGLQEQGFTFLVFLDVYDNQLDKINSLDTLENLRVLLMGKNRIKKIEGLDHLIKLEVLDLHGNMINHISGLTELRELKVLNLAGNQIKIIGLSDLKGLLCLQELNLRRNRLKKLLGFGDVPQLQKLFLSNNEIQAVEDMSSIAKAINLREVAVDDNPVSIGGECVSFLVSYLPQLTLLSNMQITEQVRKAAMAWRRNKESSNSAFMDLTSDVSLNVHREEIISNARTNWELIRSQTKCITTKNSCTVYKDFKINSDFVLTTISKPEIKNSARPKRVSTANCRMSVLPDKKLQVIRSSSQETENSQNSSSTTSNSNEFFRLPPILVPIINKMETSTNNTQLKRWGSLSSIGPNVDSSSFPSSTETSPASSDSESEKEFDKKSKPLTPPISEPKTQNPPLSIDTSSTISTNSVAPGSSTSGSELNTEKPTRATSRTSSKRSVKSAYNQKSANVKPSNRAATAKIKSRDPSPQIEVSKDREQGGDYLIEICGRYLNVYGQGALRFIDKPWNPIRANDVQFIKFSYVNFNNLIGIFCKFKNRFPNIDGLIFCETNICVLGQLNALAEVQGFSSLQIEEDGNPIFKKNWRSYAIYRLSHWGLKTINGTEITEEEIANVNEEYQSLSDLVLWSLPDILLQPLLARLQLDIDYTSCETSAKKWLMNADPALRSVVSKEALQWRRGSVSQEDMMWRQKAKTHVSSLLESVCLTVEKLRVLDTSWSKILNDILKDIMKDYLQLDTYMKEKLHELL